MTDKLLRRWLVPASLVLVAACAGTGTPVDQGPGAPATMTKTGDAQSAVVANRVQVQPLVVLRDADGRPVPGQTVTFSVAAGDGWVTSSTATSDAGGAATTVWYLGPRAGSSRRCGPPRQVWYRRVHGHSHAAPARRVLHGRPRLRGTGRR
jgi:hypothetical protein